MNNAIFSFQKEISEIFEQIIVKRKVQKNQNSFFD
jgi:hypothetical protein